MRLAASLLACALLPCALLSCAGEDEEPVHPVVGVWTIEPQGSAARDALRDAPGGAAEREARKRAYLASAEGTALAHVYATDFRMDLDVRADGTFRLTFASRSVDATGVPGSESGTLEGSWRMAGVRLVLSSEGARREFAFHEGRLFPILAGEATPFDWVVLTRR